MLLHISRSQIHEFRLKKPYVHVPYIIIYHINEAGICSTRAQPEEGSRGRRGAHHDCYGADAEQAAGPTEEPTTTHLDEPLVISCTDGILLLLHKKDITNVDLKSRRKRRNHVLVMDPVTKTCPRRWSRAPWSSAWGCPPWVSLSSPTNTYQCLAPAHAVQKRGQSTYQSDERFMTIVNLNPWSILFDLVLVSVWMCA